MVHFEGVEAFALPPSHVFAKLADAGFLANSLPEATVMLATPDKSSWKVKPKMAFIAGELATDVVPGAALAHLRRRAEGTVALLVLYGIGRTHAPSSVRGMLPN